jgi:hypothetical protein
MEVYNGWRVTSLWPPNLYVQGLHDDYEGFRIVLENKDGGGEVYKIVFASYLAYRNMDEGDRLRGLSLLKKTRDKTGIIYKVEESEWVKWFKEENSGKYDVEDIYHWAIVTPNDWIDVLSLEPPTVVELT